MPTTRLTDAIIPEVYASYAKVDDMTKTALFQSGVIVQNEQLNQFANSAGHSFNLPFWNDLDADDTPNLASDNPADIAEPSKITANKQIGFKALLNKPFSAADLVGELAGSDPMKHIRARFSTYWKRQYQKRLVSTMRGVMKDNVASNDGDMVYDISVDDASSITSDNLFGVNAFTGATFTMGDAFEELGAIIMHSMVYKRVVEKNEAQDVRASDGTLLYRAYKGLRIVVDDSMPVTAVSTGTGYKYLTAIVGAGALGYGQGKPANAVEVSREALQGNGGGVETIIERKTCIIHPFGYKATEGASTSGHTLAELENANTFTRVVPRKNVPVAFLITNG